MSRAAADLAWHGGVVDLLGLRVFARAGLLTPVRPDRLLGMGLALARWGRTAASGYAAGAARHPDLLAVVDEEGGLTYRDIDRRTDRLAGELRARGVREGDAVGLVAHNGRGFVESVVALGKCGADVLLLNPGAAGAQLAQVLDREGAVALVYDDELADLVTCAGGGRLTLGTDTLGRLARSSTLPAPARPLRSSRLVVLTSGTTGAPRGTARSSATADDAVAVLSAIPLRARQTTVIAAPLFHALGLGQLMLAMLLGSTVVLQRWFDPARVLQAVQDHEATGLVVVPVMLDRLLGAGPGSYDTSSLRVVVSSGSALPGRLAARTLEAFGPVLFNLYGSTEAAYATVATPDDLAQDPRTAGRPLPGVNLRVVYEAGRDLAPGVPGRIYVGSGLAFAGYTDGGDRDRLDGLVATGDLGVLDGTGRLTVLGRDDELVVIGGENVHPGQVEDVLLTHPRVRDCAVTAAEDPSYGVRLVAHVVGDAEPDELRQLVRASMARFAVPREFRFVAELPRTSTGKVLRRVLRAGSDGAAALP